VDINFPPSVVIEGKIEREISDRVRTSFMDRPSLDEYFMEIASVVGTRSTCLRHHVGAVLVRDKRILSTGYNGAPTGLPHCLEVGCRRENVESGYRHELCRAVHAEQNAIILYCTHQPCILCAKIIINSQIRRVVYGNPYPDDEALQFLEQGGVEVCQITGDETPQEGD
jgi:dCMP deaminase